MTTYLQAVNEVLARLRESSVATVSTNAYSTLIGKYINDSKRSVEDAWDWNCLSQALTVNTTPGVSTYTVTGSGRRPKGISVNNTTNKNRVNNVPLQWIMDQQQLTTMGQASPPVYYAWNGIDGTDNKVELFPTPGGTATLIFNLYVPQLPLVADGDILIVPSEAVIAGAYARAIAERGEDGGLATSEAYGLFKSILADQIALESNNFVEYETWEPT
jgi:hypothetical protein